MGMGVGGGCMCLGRATLRGLGLCMAFLIPLFIYIYISFFSAIAINFSEQCATQKRLSLRCVCVVFGLGCVYIHI